MKFRIFPAREGRLRGISLSSMAQTPHAEQTGKQGESIALQYLLKKGYKLIQRNFDAVRGEIDLVMADNRQKQIVFVEVKTRTNEKYGSIYESITKSKFQKILHASEEWFYKKMQHRQQFPDFRVDAILITLKKDKAPLIEHLKNIGWDDF